MSEEAKTCTSPKRSDFLTAVRQSSGDIERLRDMVQAELGRDVKLGEVRDWLRDMVPKEAVFQKDIMHHLARKYPDAFIWKVAQGPYSRDGIPDIAMIYKGIYFGFEVKRPFLGEVSKIQAMTIRQIKDAGGQAGIVCYPEDADRLVEDKLGI